MAKIGTTSSAFNYNLYFSSSELFTITIYTSALQNVHTCTLRSKQPSPSALDGLQHRHGITMGKILRQKCLRKNDFDWLISKSALSNMYTCEV